MTGIPAVYILTEVPAKFFQKSASVGVPPGVDSSPFCKTLLHAQQCCLTSRSVGAAPRCACLRIGGGLQKYEEMRKT